MKKTISIVLLAVAGLMALAYYGWIKIDIIDTKNPQYLEYVQERINFGTVQCDNTLQWDSLTIRITNFFEQNTQYIVPDSIEISEPKYSGSSIAEFEKAIYFSTEPKEVYVVTFSTGSFNHIDFLYTFKDDELIKQKTDKLSDKEKRRILQRLKSEVLSKIDWDVSNIHF